VGILESIEGNLVYLDVNIWIYALEGYPDFLEEMTLLFQAIDQGRLKAVTSEISLAEALVKPMQLQNESLQQAYCRAISNRQNMAVIPVEREILIWAARLRSTSKLKLPDAIHGATALKTGCTSFLTNDRAFKSLTDLHTIVLSDVASSN
jgi:predicted nucleic acid-binding protein